MDEARALRLHKQRLEHRSRILEQQNEQLELQLQRLKKVIEQVLNIECILTDVDTNDFFNIFEL